VIVPPQFLISLAKPWADFYSDSTAATTIVTFVHVAALLFAGGAAIAADRGTLRVAGEARPDRIRHLAELRRLHRSVMIGVAAIVVSGALMLAADLEAFFGSWVYWTKMALFVALLANGYRMTRLERTLVENPASDPSDPTVDRVSAESTVWRGLRGAAMTSLVLWFTVTFFGILLVNAA
jgi:hypothetical protein